MRIRIKVTVATAAMALICPPLYGQSQCYALHYGCSTDAHTATGSGASIGAPQHASCNICPGESIFECHDECGGTFAGVAREAYETIVAAASLSDVRTLFAVAPLVPGMVVFNAARQAVQVMDCRGERVVASLPLRSAALLRLADAFARSEGSGGRTIAVTRSVDRE